MSRHRNVCVTFNNYPQTFDPTTFQTVCKYYVIGKEVGESKTPHLQCYLEFTRPLRIKKIQTMFGSKVHVEKRKGSPSQAADYCKKDGNFVEYGTISSPGKRNDIKNLREAVKRGDSIVTLYENHDAMWKYHRAAKDYRYHLHMQDKKYTPMEIIVRYGEPGLGKTRAPCDMYPDIFHVPGTTKLWFNGYQGEETILIDDFYGEMDYSIFLKITEGYRFSIPVKGAYVWKSYKRVFITSNRHPRTWYPNRNYTAIERRITRLIEVVGPSITPTSVPVRVG